MNFFYRQLCRDYDVTVCKLGDGFDFQSRIKTLDRRSFNSLPKSVLKRRTLQRILTGFIRGYDLVIVSVPPYTLMEVVWITIQAGVEVFLDVRDLPDLIYVEKKTTRPLLAPLWKLNLWIQFRYIVAGARACSLVMAAGHQSAAILQEKMRNHGRIINVANGFTMDDYDYVAGLERHHARRKDQITIGFGGSIHNFRDTGSLRSFFERLNSLREASGKEIIVKHYGTATAGLRGFISELKNITYMPMGFVERKRYLKELLEVDYLLLACSDDLIWEPTTTVFDYLLVNKPVIFIGLHNNEAYSILENSGCTIIRHDRFHDHAVAGTGTPGKTDMARLNAYSREFNFKKVLNELDQSGT